MLRRVADRDETDQSRLSVPSLVFPGAARSPRLALVPSLNRLSPKPKSPLRVSTPSTPCQKIPLKLKIFPASGSGRASPYSSRLSHNRELLSSPILVLNQHARTPTTPRINRRRSVSGNQPLTPLPTPPPREQLKLIRMLGTGGFGSVFLGEWAGRRVAIKTLHACTRNHKARQESFRAELLTVGMRHPNVVRTLAASSMDFGDGTYLVMEHAGDNNLLEIINDPAEPMDAERRLRYSLQIARGLAFIHRNRIAHLDLKPANVFVSPGDICKVGDFGCCQHVEETGRVSPHLRSYLTGTFAYRAPEVLRGQPSSTKADIYSIGITMWQMLVRMLPYAGENQHVVIFGVVAYGRRPSPASPPVNSAIETVYNNLYHECWNSHPDKRPSAKDICEALEACNQYL